MRRSPFRSAFCVVSVGLSPMCTPNALAQTLASDARADIAAPATLAPVVVTGRAMREGASTEGSGAYATDRVTLGLGEHTARETPNSVSVVTRQRIDDQNLLTVEQAMQHTTAMKMTTYGNTSSGIESRGYTINRYQTDGVSSLASVYDNNFALAMFDRIEVWRGPAGLLQGSGDPGGTINFARKRALDQFGFNAKLALGSWNHRYGEADVTGPLTDDGRLRGRVVASYLDRADFVDHASTRQPLLYGTLEYDLTRDTTLSVGSSWQKKRNLPFRGLSAFDDGTYPDLPRSTYLGTAWSNVTQEAQRSFAELTHRFGSGAKATLTAVTIDRRNHAELEWGNGFIDRATGNVPMVPYFSRGTEKEADVDARVTLPFLWLGQAQEIVAGASYQKLRSSSAYNASTYGQGGFLQNTFAPNADVPKPSVTLDPDTHATQTESAAFGQVRFKPVDALTLLAGARVTWFKSQNIEVPANDQRIDGKLVPYAGLVFDLSERWSVYGSYSGIFNPQTDRTFAGNYLPPRKGRQFEVGAKSELLDGQLTTSFALYRIEDTNRAIADPANPGFSIAAGKVRSEGFETEVTGRILKNWNATAGYGYNSSRLIQAAPGDEGKPLNSYYPRHTFSLWSDYRFTQAPVQGLSVGGGMRFRSPIYVDDGTARWGQSSFAVFALQLGYQITPQWKTSVTVNNLFDRKYFDRPDSGWRQTYYGEPRSVMLTLSYRI